MLLLPTTNTLLLWIVAAEALVVGGVFVGLLVRGGWLRGYRARSAAVLERGRAVLAVATEGVLPAEDARWLTSLPQHYQIQLFTSVAPFVRGEGRERLAELAADLGLLALAEQDCRSRRWWRRLRGSRLYSKIGGGEHVMPTLLNDPHPSVRTQAAEWAALHPTPAVIDGLVQRLNDPAGFCRFTTQDSLLRMGDVAAEALARHLEARHGAAAQPGLRVAEALAQPVMLSPTLALAEDEVAGTRAGAVAVLGKLGGEEGISALEQRLTDPEPEVRSAAARALGTLGHWPAAPALARLLSDRAWIVRRESALGLRRLGAPGLLLLRRAQEHPDPFAADMARQVLELPDTVYRRGTP